MLLNRVFPLPDYPVPYFLLTVLIACRLGVGPAAPPVVVGWIAFTYCFIPEATGLNASLREQAREREQAQEALRETGERLPRIAFDNLLGSARKFTGKEEVTRVKVASIELNGERVYSIRDNGVGFDPAYADKLFQPFQRLHSQSDFPGTGIGFALVERVVRRHGAEPGSARAPSSASH